MGLNCNERYGLLRKDKESFWDSGKSKVEIIEKFVTGNVIFKLSLLFFDPPFPYL
jgi:hypothetical protein